MKKRVLWIVVLGIVFSVVALPVVADESVEGRSGRAEVRYMVGMIDHHQMALDMAQDCLNKAETDVVLELCQAVIDAQTAEIQTMQAWLQDWYDIECAPMPMVGINGADEQGSMDGMMGGQHESGNRSGQGNRFGMMGMMAGLDVLDDREYEIAWLEAMIDHHDDAINMSERLLSHVEHDDLRALAQQIIADQTSEIETMETLIGEMGEA